MSGIDTLNLGWIEGGDTEIASFLRNTGGLVNIRDSSLPPAAGDALIAIDAQNAAWSPIPSGTQDLQSVLSYGNSTGSFDIVAQQKIRMPNAAPTGTTNLLNVTTGAGAPTSAVGVNEGSLYYDSTNNLLYVYDTVSGWITNYSTGAGAVPTLAQVLTVGSTASVGQVISMNTGMKLAQAGILDVNSNTVLNVINNVAGTNAHTRISAGAANAAISTVNTVAPASDVALVVTPQNNGAVNFMTSASSQVYTDSYFASKNQTRMGGAKLTASSVPPGPDPIQTVGATAFVRLVFNGILFDDNNSGGSYIDNANDWLVIPPGIATWMISANVAGREAADHTNSITLRFRLVVDDTVVLSSLATDFVQFPSSSQNFSSNMCIVYGSSATNPQRVYVDFNNTANANVEIITYRLKAVRIN